MELCNPLTNVEDLRLTIRSQYALPKRYATKMNRKQVCNAFQKCSGKDLPLPPMRYQKVNPTTGVHYPRDTPLSGRDFYNLFSNPKLKELQRLARKLGVFQKDATKSMLFMSITEFLKALGVPEPVQVRLSPNKSSPRFVLNNNLKPSNNNNNLKPSNNNNNSNLKPSNNNNNLRTPPQRRVGPPVGGPTFRPKTNAATAPPPPPQRRIPLPPAATPRLRDYEELMRKSRYGNESSLKSWGVSRGLEVGNYKNKGELFNGLRRQQRDKLNVEDLRTLAKSLGMKNTSSYKTKNGLERAIYEFKKTSTSGGPPVRGPPVRVPPPPAPKGPSNNNKKGPPPPQIVEVTKAIKNKNISKLRNLENSTNSNVAKTAKEARVAVETKNNTKLRRVAEDTNKTALRNLRMYANRKGVKNASKYETVETLERAIKDVESRPVSGSPNAALNYKLKETRAAANAARVAKNNKRAAELKEREMKLVAQIEKNKAAAANKLEKEKAKLATNLERKKAEANAARALQAQKNKNKANVVATKLEQEKMKLAANLERKKAEVNAAKASNNTKLAAKLEQEKMELAARLERKKAEVNAARSKPGLNFSLPNIQIPKFQRAPPEVRAARRAKFAGIFKSKVQKIFDEVYPGVEAGNKREANKFVAAIKKKGKNASSVNAIYNEIYGNKAQLEAEGRNGNSIMAKRTEFKRKLLGAVATVAKEAGVPQAEVTQAIVSEPTPTEKAAANRINKIFNAVYPGKEAGNANKASEFKAKIRNLGNKINTNTIEGVFKDVYVLGKNNANLDEESKTKRTKFTRLMLNYKKSAAPAAAAPAAATTVSTNEISSELKSIYEARFDEAPKNTFITKVKNSNRSALKARFDIASELGVMPRNKNEITRIKNESRNYKQIQETIKKLDIRIKGKTKNKLKEITNQQRNFVIQEYSSDPEILAKIVEYTKGLSTTNAQKIFNKLPANKKIVKNEIAARRLVPLQKTFANKILGTQEKSKIIYKMRQILKIDPKQVQNNAEFIQVVRVRASENPTLQELLARYNKNITPNQIAKLGGKLTGVKNIGTYIRNAETVEPTAELITEMKTLKASQAKNSGAAKKLDELIKVVEKRKKVYDDLKRRLLRNRQIFPTTSYKFENETRKGKLFKGIKSKAKGMSHLPAYEKILKQLKITRNPENINELHGILSGIEISNNITISKIEKEMKNKLKVLPEGSSENLNKIQNTHINLKNKSVYKNQDWYKAYLVLRAKENGKVAMLKVLKEQFPNNPLLGEIRNLKLRNAINGVSVPAPAPAPAPVVQSTTTNYLNNYKNLRTKIGQNKSGAFNAFVNRYDGVNRNKSAVNPGDRKAADNAKEIYEYLEKYKEAFEGEGTEKYSIYKNIKTHPVGKFVYEYMNVKAGNTIDLSIAIINANSAKKFYDNAKAIEKLLKDKTKSKNLSREPVPFFIASQNRDEQLVKKYYKGKLKFNESNQLIDTLRSPQTKSKQNAANENQARKNKNARDLLLTRIRTATKYLNLTKPSEYALTQTNKRFEGTYINSALSAYKNTYETLQKTANKEAAKKQKAENEKQQVAAKQRANKEAAKKQKAENEKKKSVAEERAREEAEKLEEYKKAEENKRPGINLSNANNRSSLISKIRDFNRIKIEERKKRLQATFGNNKKLSLFPTNIEILSNLSQTSHVNFNTKLKEAQDRRQLADKRLSKASAKRILTNPSAITIANKSLKGYEENINQLYTTQPTSLNQRRAKARGRGKVSNNQRALEAVERLKDIESQQASLNAFQRAQQAKQSFERQKAKLKKVNHNLPKLDKK